MRAASIHTLRFVQSCTVETSVSEWEVIESVEQILRLVLGTLGFGKYLCFERLLERENDADMARKHAFLYTFIGVTFSGFCNPRE